MTWPIRAPLIAGTGPLKPGNAVAALILVEDRGYLMQRRDPRPDIWYPDHWGLFGGGVDAGEDPTAALARELREELDLTLRPGQATLFANLDFDLTPTGLGRYYRSCYTVPVGEAEHTGFALHEGAEMRIFTADEILNEINVTPYDAFVLFLHARRARLVG